MQLLSPTKYMVHVGSHKICNPFRLYLTGSYTNGDYGANAVQYFHGIASVCLNPRIEGILIDAQKVSSSSINALY